jgi:hypothetical protein
MANLKANELRIGNLILGKSQIVRVEDILDIGINYDREIEEILFALEDLSGIPLTEEWLIKLGFIAVDRKWRSPKEELFELQDVHSDNVFYHIWDAAFTGSPMKYVHQLQNLYMALTGEELIAK